MLTPLRDHREPRSWSAIWRDPPGFFIPGCFCCGSAVPLQGYHVFGGENPSGTRLTDNNRTTPGAGSWGARASLPGTGASLFGATSVSNISPCWCWPLDFTTRTNSQFTQSTNSWATDTAEPSPLSIKFGFTTVGGLAYQFGNGNVLSAVALSFTPSGTSGSWTTLTSIPISLGDNAAAYYSTFAYLIAGVTTPGITLTNAVYQYDPSGNSYSSKTAAPKKIENAWSTTWTISGNIHSVVGLWEAGPLAGTQHSIYSGVGDSWSTGTAPPANSHQAASVISEAAGVSLDLDSQNCGFITGGNSQDGTFITDSHILNGITWTGAGAYPHIMARGIGGSA